MSVVSTDQYRYQTGDVSTSDEDVASGLAEAQSMVEDHLNRGLELMERTEVCLVQTGGYVYPKVTPVVSVATPTDATVVDETYLQAGGEDYPFPTGFQAWVLEPTAGRSHRTQIVYTGGWTSVTLPVTLRRGIIELAAALRVGSTPFVAGASSVSLGDASVSFGANAPTTPIDMWVPGLSRRINGYRAR